MSVSLVKTHIAGAYLKKCRINQLLCAFGVVNDVLNGSCSGSTFLWMVASET